MNTYQAYNNWGGKSLYAFDSDSTGPATKVSFNRPYQISYGYDGSGDFLTGWEYDMVRFLEREGYDVTYGTDVDLHENPSLLLSHKGALIVGHSEYWSKAMRNNFVAARDAGVSLGVLAANVCYWQVRFEPSVVNPAAPDRTMVGYKDFATSFTAPGPDPYYAACIGRSVPIDTTKCPFVTVQWRQAPVNLPENAFIGVMWANAPVNGDIVVTNTSNWVFDTTGLQNDDTLPGLLGYEVDGLFSNGQTPAGIVTLGASPYTTTGTPPASGTSNMAVYTTTSGATVFAAGTFQFSWGLDDYSQLLAGGESLVSFAAQQMTRNLLAQFIGDQPPLANPGGPYTRGTLQSIQFDGTGSADPDGTIVTYQWDFGDGTTGTGSRPVHAYSQAGTYTVSLIVTDNAGSRNAATTTSTISDQSLVSLSPSALSFENQNLGMPAPPQSVTLTNDGGAALTFSGFSASGDFAVTGSGTTCSTSSQLAVNASCTIAVTFNPAVAGPRKSSIVIADNAINTPQLVILTGVGVAASLSPASLTFTSQTVGVASASQVVTLTNMGSGPMNVWQIAFLGANAQDFSMTSTCGTTLGAGAGCTISVTFTPGAAGTRSASLMVSDDGGGSPQGVLITGTDVAAAPGTSSGSSGGATGVGASNGLSASALSFGSQKVGTSSSPQSATFTNTRKTTTTIRKINVSGSGHGDFWLSNTCGARVGAGKSCILQITFTPHVLGARTAVITIDDDAPGSPPQLLVDGVGVRP